MYIFLNFKENSFHIKQPLWCVSSHFAGPYVEDDLNPDILASMQCCCCISLIPGLTDGLQLLSHSHTSGLAQSDSGSMDLPAPERDSPEEVLPGGQRCI